jgi:hypothetical protein
MGTQPVPKPKDTTYILATDILAVATSHIGNTPIDPHILEGDTLVDDKIELVQSPDDEQELTVLDEKISNDDSSAKAGNPSKPMNFPCTIKGCDRKFGIKLVSRITSRLTSFGQIRDAHDLTTVKMRRYFASSVPGGLTSRSRTARVISSLLRALSPILIKLEIGVEASRSSFGHNITITCQ